MAENYKQHRERLKAEQAGMSKQDIKQELEQRSEYVLDLDNIPKQTHIWVKRGAVVSCEGANHPSHRHFLVSRRGI